MPRAAQIISFAALAAATAIAAGTVAATLAAPDRAMAVEVYLKSAGKAVPLRGGLVKFDEQTFTLHVGADDRTLNWTDATPATAFALKQKLTDRTKPDQMLELGQFGWAIGAKEQAQTALRAAVKLDPSLKSQADTTLASPLGPVVATTQPKPGKGADLMNSGNATPPVPPAAPPSADPDKPGETIKFHAATPEQAAEAMERSRKQMSGVEEKIGVQLAEFETPHFLVFTDWDPRDFEFLRTNLEGAYETVAKQFEMSPKDNVFVGKLPVYMLVRYEDFAAFAKEIDEFNGVTSQTAGYYMGNNQGLGHMAMWKPNEKMTGTSNIDDARRLWAYVLVHEFTHAFLARYKSNEFVPRWLNEGIAEVIAYNQFPYGGRRRMARMLAQSKADVSFLFNDRNRPTGEYYPVMQSMVELLVSSNRQNFLKLVDGIKDGKKPEKMMQELYHVDYEQFAEEWRDWAKRRTDD